MSNSTKATPKSVSSLFRGRLNLHSDDLQDEIGHWISEFNKPVSIFSGGKRVDMRANGMLSDIVASTSVIVYDLPALKLRCSTAFADTAGHIYFADTFLRKLLKEQREGKDSFFFVLRHEAEHVRRMHLQRMIDIPHDVANIAQDIRINLDCAMAAVSAKMVAEQPGIKVTFDSAFERELKAYQDNLGETLKIGVGLTFEDYIKYAKMSEESIAADLMQSMSAQQAQSPQQGQQEVSFSALMEGAAQDLDALTRIGKTTGGLTPNVMPSATRSNQRSVAVSVLTTALAQECRAIGKSKGGASTSVMSEALAGLVQVMDLPEMTDRDLEHEALQKTIGQVTPSVSTGDGYVDTQTPRGRIYLAAKMLDMVMNPAPGQSAPQRGGQIKVKDLENMQGKSSGDDPETQASNDSLQSSCENASNHVISAQEVAKILRENGLHESASKLGYDDLKSIEKQEQAAKGNVVAAINKATEDSIALGSNMLPGGHLVDYANAKVNDFFKPVLTWKMAIKELSEGTGRSVRYEDSEPWSPFYVDHADMGLASAGDIPYNGSFTSSSNKRPVLLILIDSSGSVSDGMLKRFATDAIHAAQDTGSEASPEVIVMFADTVCRGEPIKITAENMMEMLQSGITYGGRGGTSFQASLENVFDLFSPQSDSEFAGRTLDGLAYFTDSFDYPPEQDRLEDKAFDCGFNQLPTTVFLVPSMCHNPGFAQATASWANTIFFDAHRELAEQNVVDFERIEDQLAEEGKRRLSPR